MGKDTYKVGFSKPPEETRFLKGKSGNNSGRPKRIDREFSEISGKCRNC